MSTSRELMAVQPSTFDNYGIVLLTTSIVFVVGALIALWLLSKKLPKGGSLGLAAAAYVAGWCAGSAAEESHGRELYAVAGALKMVGFIGIILGVVDLVRNCKSVPGSDASTSDSPPPPDSGNPKV
jgi:hypothetical protein